MKAVYTGTLLILIAVMIVLCIYAYRRKGEYRKNILSILSASIIVSIVYCLFLNCEQENAALALDAYYFWMGDILSLFMLIFVEKYTSNQNDNEVRPYHKILAGLAVLDGIMFIVNNFTHWTFSLERVMTGRTEYFTENFSILIVPHLVFCYLVIAYSVFLLIRKLKTAERINRKRYSLILGPFVLLVILNAISYNLGLPIDLSLVWFGITASLICLCVYHVIPNAFVDAVKSYITDNVDDAIFCYDNAGNCVYVNKAVSDSKWWNDSEYRKKDEEYIRAKVDEINESGNGGGLFEWKDEIHETEDLVEYIEFSYNVITGKEGQREGYFIVAKNRTEQELAARREEYRATHDALTGLLNREAFFEKADKIIQEDPGSRKWFVASDIRDFKLINNIFGNDFGDSILKLQADEIRKSMDEDGFCGRISGDRFAMMVVRSELKREKFDPSVELLRNFAHSSKYSLKYHIGIYDITGLNVPAETIYNNLKLAMDMDHNDYNKLFTECDSKVMEKILYEKDLIASFDDALEDKQFKMYLQPQIGIDGRLCGAEALVRWQQPGGKLIPPFSFIPAFEKAGIIYRLDRYMWESAAAKLKEWKETGREDLYISVNISTNDFYYVNLFDEFTGLVEKYDIDPSNLKLEITESAIMSGTNENFETLAKLRNAGFVLEMDDFGSGYSSLGMIKDVVFDVIKIDQAFLYETENAHKSAVIYKAIKDLAGDLGMTVVSEGVENEKQVKFLKDIGCDILQGYYFSMPIPCSEFESKYLSGR